MMHLERGAKGQDVAMWQSFLRERGWLRGPVDGAFGAETQQATRRFQASRRLEADGVVGPATLSAAEDLGFHEQQSAPPRVGPTSPAMTGESARANDFFPPKPDFAPLVGTAARQRAFGSFSFEPSPTPSNPEAIKVTNDWARRNLVQVTVPGLAGVPLGSGHGTSSGRVTFHTSAAGQLVSLWRAWNEAGLVDRIRTFDGAYNARFQRNSHTELSNHAFGTAFDINARWNRLKQRPAAIGRDGCVLELVSIANEHGFYWGGHFTSRPDGMHFEVARAR